MKNYKCLDCGSDMEYEGGLIWNSILTKCYYKFKCLNCGSKFEHRLTMEEEKELTERGKQREIKCAICGRTDIMLPPDPRGLLRDLRYDSAIIVCDNCRNAPILVDMHGEQYILDIKPKSSAGWIKLLWRKIKGR